MISGKKVGSLRILLGSVAWILCGQYFLVETFVSRAWQNPLYSFRNNTISDLGATVCPYVFPGTEISACSPLHVFMNSMFIENSILIIIGCLLLRPLFSQNRFSTSGLWLLGIGSLGLLGVGLVPENTNTSLHIALATTFFLLTNFGLVTLGVGMRNAKLQKRGWYTAVSGIIALGGLVGIVLGAGHVIGSGFVERIASDPFTIWLVVMGGFIAFQTIQRSSCTEKKD